MGFFDREVKNSLDRMFDYNRDGFLNCGEQAMEHQYLEELSSPSESDRRIAGFSESALFDDDDDSESGLSISELSDLSDRTGLSITELELEYYVAAEPPVRCGESHHSGQTEPPCY